MPTLATFNANNFFLRYKFANTYPGDMSKKSAVDAADISLGYVPGKVFGNYVQTKFVVWDAARRDLAAQALAEPDGVLPDIMCLQEVENMVSIRVLNEYHLGKHYKYAMLVDGYDPRNIDVAVLSVFPILDVRSHVDDVDSTNKRIFSRDCLEVTLDIGSKPLTVFVNHLKSKFVDTRGKTKAKVEQDTLAGHKKRLAQAQFVQKLVRARFKGQHSKALYAVVGDFNDTEESPWVKPLVKSSLLTDVVAPRVNPDDRWTYYWRSKGRVQQIDFILASEALAKRVGAAHIERSGLAYRTLNADGEILPKKVTLVHFEDDGVTPKPSSATANKKIPFPNVRYTPIFDDVSANISDHCPVKIWF